MFNPSRYRILSVGKIRKDWIKEGISLYLKRLPGLSITEIRNSNPQKEAESILSSLRKDELPVVLDEKYKTLSSIEFANHLQTLQNQRLAFIIGGTEGLNANIKNIAEWKLSLSPLTFPHEIARLLFIEQLYRAQSILQGSPYHRF